MAIQIKEIHMSFQRNYSVDELDEFKKDVGYLCSKCDLTIDVDDNKIMVRADDGSLVGIFYTTDNVDHYRWIDFQQLETTSQRYKHQLMEAYTISQILKHCDTENGFDVELLKDRLDACLEISQ